MGAGLEDLLVGKNSDNKDVNISGGGGVSLTMSLNMYFKF